MSRDNAVMRAAPPIATSPSASIAIASRAASCHALTPMPL